MLLRNALPLLVLGLLLSVSIGCDSGSNQLAWAKSFPEASTLARKDNRLIMVKFTAEWCGPCKDMEQITFSNPSVASELGHVVPVRVDVDSKDGKQLSDYYRVESLPTVVFMLPDGTEVSRMVGLYPPDMFLSFYHTAQAKSNIY